MPITKGVTPFASPGKLARSSFVLFLERASASRNSLSQTPHAIKFGHSVDRMSVRADAEIVSPYEAGGRARERKAAVAG
jgi:hypothetical protein